MKKLIKLLIFSSLFWGSGVSAQSSLMLPNSLVIPKINTFSVCNNTTKGQMVYNNLANKIYYCNGSEWESLTESPWLNINDNVYLTLKNVGIGTTNPSEKLHVLGNIKSSGRMDASGVIEGAGLSSTGSLYANGTSLLQGAVTGASTGLFYGKLTSNTGMEINDAAGLLNFKTGGNDKGFLQLSGDNLRIGTYSGNTLGKFVIRTHGNDQVEVDGSSGSARMNFNSGGNTIGRISASSNGNLSIITEGNDDFININNEVYVIESQNRVGIGTASPEEKLDIRGNIKTYGDLYLTGRILKSTNLDTSFLPLAFGRVGFSGDVQTMGSGNWTSENSSTGIYRIYQADISYYSTIMVTLNSSNAQIVHSAGCSDGYCTVYLKDGFSNNNAFAPINQFFILRFLTKITTLPLYRLVNTLLFMI